MSPYMDQMQFVEHEIALLDERLEEIGQQRRELAQAVARWDTVPGIDRVAGWALLGPPSCHHGNRPQDCSDLLPYGQKPSRIGRDYLGNQRHPEREKVGSKTQTASQTTGLRTCPHRTQGCITNRFRAFAVPWKRNGGRAVLAVKGSLTPHTTRPGPLRAALQTLRYEGRWGLGRQVNNSKPT